MKVKSNFFIICLLAVGSLIFISGCKEEMKSPIIAFSLDVVYATFEGGDFSVAYTVENSVQGAIMTVNCDADWITDFNLKTEGQIKFKVSKNGIEGAREAIVTVNYPGINPVPTFTVKQEIGVPPTIAFSPETVEVPAKGGDLSVAYKIENPIEGAEIAVKCEADWITDFNLETEGQILFKVAKNKIQEAREAAVEINYPGVNSVPTFIVKQEIGAPDPFTIEVSDVSYTSMTVNIISYDKEMKYIYQFIETAYLEKHNLTEDDALFAEDINYFSQLAESNGYSLNEVLGMFALGGDTTGEDWAGLTPATSYTIYAYGIDVEKAERLTDIVRYEVSTEAVSKIDAKFDIDPKVNGVIADIKVTPINYDGYYLPVVGSNFEESTPEEEIAENIANFWMTYYNMFMFEGYTYEMILQETGLCATGVYSGIFNDLAPTTLYVAAVVAVNKEALICSDVSYKFFVTGEVEPSDNIIDIKVSDIKSRQATIMFIPSNNDPYTIGLFPAEEIKGYSDEDIIASLLSYPYNIAGKYTETVPLEPNTEYKVFAVGCVSSVPTTGLFQTSLTTPEAVVANVNVKMEYNDYADAAEVGKIDENYAQFAYQDNVFMGITFTSEPTASSIHFGFIRTEDYEAGDWENDAIIKALLGEMPLNGPYEIGSMKYGDKLIGCAIGEDENGDFGPLYIGKPIEITKDGVMDSEEWLAKYPYPYGGEAEAKARVARVPFNLNDVKANTPLSRKLDIRKHAKKHYNISSEKGFISRVSIDKEEIMQNAGFTVNRVRRIKK